MSVIAKPPMRNLLINNVKKHLVVAIALSIAGSAAAKIFWANPRKEKVNEFFRTYDVEKENARLTKLGFNEYKFINK